MTYNKPAPYSIKFTVQYTSIHMLYLSTLTVAFRSQVPHSFAFRFRAITKATMIVITTTMPKMIVPMVVREMIAPTTAPKDTSPACTRGYT